MHKTNRADLEKKKAKNSTSYNALFNLHNRRLNSIEFEQS